MLVTASYWFVVIPLPTLARGKCEGPIVNKVNDLLLSPFDPTIDAGCPAAVRRAGLACTDAPGVDRRTELSCFIPFFHN